MLGGCHELLLVTVIGSSVVVVVLENTRSKYKIQ